MGYQKRKQYGRMLTYLRGMMGFSLFLLGIVIILIVRASVLSQKVDRLEKQLSAEEKYGGNKSDIQKTDQMDYIESKDSEATTKVTAETTVNTESRKYVVCLDAGHGGTGGKGAISTLDNRYESHDTLKITLAVQKALEKYSDVVVVMTRDEDVEVDNGVRAGIANSADSDLFVSFHRNSNTTGGISGVEGWIHSSNPEDSRAAGELILSALENVGVAANFGIKSGTGDEPDVNYKIIRLAEMPAVLLEIGYLNSELDNRLFDQNYEAYAQATADAIYLWLTEWVERKEN